PRMRRPQPLLRYYPGRKVLPANRPALHRHRRLAADTYGHRRVLRRDDVAAHIFGAQTPRALERSRHNGSSFGGAASNTWSVADRAAAAADDRRRLLLRDNGDAAGPNRRLLRGSRLRPRAGGRNAIADAGPRPHQPPSLWLDRRPHRRPQDTLSGIDFASGDGAPLHHVRRA